MSSILKVDQLQDSGGNAIITSNGSGTITPNFKNAGTTVLIHEASSTVDIAQLDIDSTYINSTYDTYYLKLYLLPATDDVNVRCQFFESGTIINGGSDYTVRTIVTGGTSYIGTKNESVDEMKIAGNSNNGNATGETAMFNINFFNVNSTTVKTQILGDLMFMNSGGNYRSEQFSGGLNDATKTIDGFRIYWSSGNISEYEYKLYGIK